jgi:hypothetical protein
MKNFVEQCWFLYGFRFRRWYFGFLKLHSTGTATGVEITDWEKALTPLLIGWYHSHPGYKFLTPSGIDNKTMRSWVKGLNRSLLCGIFCAIHQRCYYYYKSEQSTRRESVIYRRQIHAVIHWPFFFGKYSENEYAIKA